MYGMCGMCGIVMNGVEWYGIVLNIWDVLNMEHFICVRTNINGLNENIASAPAGIPNGSSNGARMLINIRVSYCFDDFQGPNRCGPGPLGAPRT